MQPKDMIKMALNVDTESIIQKLKHIRYYQSAVFEDTFKDYQQISKMVKHQKELEKKQQYQSVEIKENNEQRYIQQNINEDYNQSIEQEILQHKDCIQKLENQVQQLERDSKNLREESTLKSAVFQNELSARFTDQKVMPFTRITIPRSVQQYYYCQNQDIIVQSEKDDPIPLLKMYCIDKRSSANNIHSNSLRQSFSCFSVYGNKLIWCTENSTEVELWTFYQPPEPLSRLSVIAAHVDSITLLQFLTQDVFISSSSKGIVKVWRADTQKLMNSFRFTSQITRCQLINFRIIPNSNHKTEKQSIIQMIAGFSDGFIRILEFSGVNLEQQENILCEVVYEVSIGKSVLQDPSIDCVSIALPPLQENEKFEQGSQICILLNEITIAASITTEPNNIYIVVPEKSKVYSLLDFIPQKIYRNSSSKKVFTLTKNYLIAGSFDGQVFVWCIKDIIHPLRFSSPSLTLKLSTSTLSALPIIMAFYDETKDTLISGDEQGNVLKWENFIQNVEKK